MYQICQSRLSARAQKGEKKHDPKVPASEVLAEKKEEKICVCVCVY